MGYVNTFFHARTKILWIVISVSVLQTVAALDSKEKMCEEANQNIVKMHNDPLVDKIKVIASGKTSVTIQWNALEGADEYQVFIGEAHIADKPATKGPLISKPCAESGSELTADVTGLLDGVPYNIYIRATRGGEFFAILQGVDVPRVRPIVA